MAEAGTSVSPSPSSPSALPLTSKAEAGREEARLSETAPAPQVTTAKGDSRDGKGPDFPPARGTPAALLPSPGPLSEGRTPGSGPGHPPSQASAGGLSRWRREAQKARPKALATTSSPPLPSTAHTPAPWPPLTLVAGGGESSAPQPEPTEIRH